MASDFLELLRRSQLVEEEPLNEYLDDLASKSGGQLPQTTEELSAALVGDGVITEWQSQKLAVGKWKGFLLDEFKLLDRYGEVGFFHAYLAERIDTKQRAILHIFPHARMTKPGLLERFRRDYSGKYRENTGTYYIVADAAKDGGSHG